MKLTHKRAFTGLIAGAIIASMPLSGAANPNEFTLKGTMWELAEEVDPHLLYAIAIAESQKYFSEGFIRPWPWAVNISGKGYYFDNRVEAESFVDEMVQKGQTNMDIGPLQINTYWHGDKVSDPKDLFTLSTAVSVASEILKDAMDSSPEDMALGIGRYHTWSDSNRAREYGYRVIQYWNAIQTEGGR